MHPLISPSNPFFSITTFIFLICTFSASISGTEERHRNCSPRFNCANQEGLSYPFWTQPRPSYCGHPDFELNCSGEYPQIRISSVDYKILSITPKSQTLKLSRTDYADNLCPITPTNTTFSPNLFGFSSGTHLITLYYKCPDLQIDNYSDGYVGNFNCGEDGEIGYYVTRNVSSPILQKFKSFLIAAAGECETNALIPVFDIEIRKVEEERTQNSLKYAIDQGFGLTWNANDSVCVECEHSNGACGFDRRSERFICYCADGAYESTCGSGKKVSVGSVKPFWRTNYFIGLSATLAAFTLISIGFIGYKRGKSKKATETDWKSEKVEALIAHKRYSYTQVKKMTKSFAHILGKGGFGIVYRGKLPDGRLVAVKMLTNLENTSEEFINEVASMSKTSHMNIVSLLGFCFERSKRAIIYEFMVNGSLDKFLSDKESSQSDGKTLYDIALGVARGLEYLHNGCNTRIVHFDIKPQNILLDEEFCPKISDFGLAKLHEKKQSMISLLEARGTYGYIAPEVFSKTYGKPSHKSDVYSYGMLLLEMVGARKKDAAEPSSSNCSSAYFPDWIYKDLERGETARRARDEINGEEQEEMVRKMILVGLWCIQSSPLDRPPMSKVVEMMEGSLETLQIPPKPLLFCPATVSNEDCPWPAEYSSFSGNS